MKRLKLAVIILFVLSLTGCVQKYTATDQQTNAVAEYMAGLLLKSDKDYDQELVSEDEIKDNSSNTDSITQTPVPTEPQNITTPGISETAVNTNNSVSNNNEPSGNINESSDKAKESCTLNQLIDQDNFDINYKSYKLVDTYPENADDAMFLLTHSEGCKMLVVSFSIKNQSDKKQTLKLLDENISYQLDVNSGTRYSPLPSVLENDLGYNDLKFDGGKTGKGLLIFEVPDTTKITKMNLIATKGSKSATIEMK